MIPAPLITKHVTLSELPSPPPGKVGWPWTEVYTPLPSSKPDGFLWPRISVVTPSFNQKQFIEETIRSVLLQGYPNLEYIINDGGSTDGSVEIIRKYEPWLSYWVSEPDGGQVNAIEKGWRHSTGEIVAYLNSDDTYLSNTVANAAHILIEHPDAVAICGGELVVDENGIVIAERTVSSVTLGSLLRLNFVPQPSVFVRRATLEQAGGLDLNFQTAFDFELWTRLAQSGVFYCIPDVFATTRWHSSAKTFTQRLHVLAEVSKTVHQILSGPVGKNFSRREQQEILAGLNFLAVSIYLDNPLKYFSAFVSNSFAALAKSPALFSQLSMLFYHRIRVMAAYYFLKYAKRRSVEKTPWGFGSTGVHWSQWQSHSRRTPLN